MYKQLHILYRFDNIIYSFKVQSWSDLRFTMLVHKKWEHRLPVNRLELLMLYLFKPSPIENNEEKTLLIIAIICVKNENGLHILRRSSDGPQARSHLMTFSTACAKISPTSVRLLAKQSRTPCTGKELNGSAEEAGRTSCSIAYSWIYALYLLRIN